MPAQRLNCSFSLLDGGRQYTGNHRKYIIENAREICNSPATKEKIRLREALGFYGHGRRILAGKMNIGEVEAVTLPDGGKAIVSNIPSNVTVAFDVSPEGVVSHSQEVLDTETGKIVSTLHASRVGGFSWACPGVDGGRGGSQPDFPAFRDSTMCSTRGSARTGATSLKAPQTRPARNR